MVKNAIITLDDKEFREMTIFKATHDLTWAELLRKGFECLKQEIEMKGDEEYED